MSAGSEGPGGDAGAAEKRRARLAGGILVTLFAGILCGLFFGEAVAWMGVIGDVYIGLMQMTVLPYIVASLVSSLGRLALDQGQKVFLRTVAMTLLAWGVACVGIVAMSASYPPLEVPAFFSIAQLAEPATPDFVEMFVPFNVFDSLTRSIVPAVVVFCLFLGMALRRLPERESLVNVLSVAAQALEEVTRQVARLTPIGVFAMTAAAAGTMSMEEFGRVQGYLVAFTLFTLVLTYWVGPAFLAGLTPFRYRAILGATHTAAITAFATGKLIIVLPLLMEETRRLFAGTETRGGDPNRTIDIVYPLAFPFPSAGKLLRISFVPFAAWFLGHPLGLFDYPMLLGSGVVSYFGGSLIATPFLLSLAGVPADMMHLFLVSGIWCHRLSVLAGAMHLAVVGILVTALTHGALHVHVRALVRAAVVSALLLVACIGGTRVFLENAFVGSHTRDEFLAELARIERPAQHVILEAAEPNPVPLAGGLTRLDRIEQRRMIRVGYRVGRRPFSFRSAGGDLVGLDVALAHDLARSLDVTLELVPIDPSRLTDHLEKDHVDLVLSGIPATLGHAVEVEMSAPYLELRVGVVVPDAERDRFGSIGAMRALGPVRVAVADATFSGPIRRNLPEAEIVTIDSREAFFQAEKPLADALIISAEEGTAWTLAYPRFSVIVPHDAPTGFPMVFALPRGEPDLKRVVDAWIGLLQRNGRIQAFYDHWVLGKLPGEPEPRWSMIRNILRWVD